MKNYDLYVVHKVVDGFGYDDYIIAFGRTFEEAKKYADNYIEESIKFNETRTDGIKIDLKHLKYITLEDYIKNDKKLLNYDNIFITGCNFGENPTCYILEDLSDKIL